MIKLHIVLRDVCIKGDRMVALYYIVVLQVRDAEEKSLICLVCNAHLCNRASAEGFLCTVKLYL